MKPRPEPPSPPVRAARRRSLPATEMPVRREDRRGSGFLSALLHIAIIILLTMPIATHTGEVFERNLNAGGAGPAGGGGGGHRGTGGTQEKVTYVRPPTPVAQQTPAVQPVVPPPVEKPVPQPVIPPPEVAKVPEVVPQVKAADLKPEMPKIEIASAVPGTGGGSGKDGSAGNGPGSGGGVGSGIGTGRGSGNGPGTGGGNQVNFPPSPTEVFIPPLPFPSKVRGFHLVAEYDVDETGKVVDFKFTPTPDGGYNKRLEDVLKNTKFRPGTRPDGTPIRMKAQIVYDF